MRNKIASALMITIALTGCQKELHLNSSKLNLANNNNFIKQDIPTFLETKPIEAPIIPGIPEPPDTVQVVSNPSDVLVVVNKTNILPADYIPKLVKPDIPFYFSDDLPKRYLRPVAAKAVQDLFLEAKKADIHLLGASGYRSYNRQKSLFSNYVNSYGLEEANKFSAYPGQSEHQTGLTLDVTSRGMNYKLEEEFGSTPEGKWLANNSYKYGFIIRYLKGKENITGYTYEPWHIRYVGIDAAKEMHNKQITLEEYLQSKNLYVIRIQDI
ncbi:M15 family metallopeptidase (plasmid) [Rossellomorea sp. AcN35-11]|nr:M15 family metallopeptidase [Rossellomorea aquimaris]WJV32159.1 M15 family metallopeptidase [Rossellomorea sp. AcN35-11]